MLKIMAESVAEYSYQVAIDNNGAFSKPNMADNLLGMVNFYMEDQNSKGRKIQSTDAAFKTLFCTVLPQHVEDIMQGHSLNGVKNTAQMVQFGQVVFATALLLQIISGMIN
jgi:hypothetical protein